VLRLAAGDLCPMVGEAEPVRAYGIDLVECVVAYQAGFAQNLVDGALPDGSSIRSSVLTGPRHTAPSRRAVAARAPPRRRSRPPGTRRADPQCAPGQVSSIPAVSQQNAPKGLASPRRRDYRTGTCARPSSLNVNGTEEIPWLGYWYQIAWARDEMDRLLAPMPPRSGWSKSPETYQTCGFQRVENG